EVPNKVPGKAINKNEAPVNISPIANFIGEEGWFFCHFTHNQAKNGVYNIINNGFNDWNQAAGNHDVSTRSAAKVAKTIDPCSSIAQNNTAAKNNGIYEKTRERSSLVTLADVVINTKYEIGKIIATIVNKLT